MSNKFPQFDIRIGNCCGCNTYPLLLFALPAPRDRYRCADCYSIEYGKRPEAEDMIKPEREALARLIEELDRTNEARKADQKLGDTPALSYARAVLNREKGVRKFRRYPDPSASGLISVGPDGREIA